MDKNKNRYCVIMAGGIGSRFWPMSREAMPKQFIDALGVGRTFIQMTFDRFEPFIPKENFVVVTGAAYKEIVLQQLPKLSEEQVLLEPARRNTAPCIAYATYRIKRANPDAVMVVTPADHLILNNEVFRQTVEKDMEFAATNNALLTIGIPPSYPATGYGYIETEDRTMPIGKVKAFKEKPDYETACSFLKSGNYVWNSGMFIWSVQAIDKAMQTLLPDIAAAFGELNDVYFSANEQQAVDKTYLASRSISIDYGIMEKADNVFVSCADFGWSDLGTWTSLYEQSPKDENNNVLPQNNIVTTRTNNCLIKQMNGKKLVVADNIDGLLVVDTDDALFICRRADENNIKLVIENATGLNTEYK